MGLHGRGQLGHATDPEAAAAVLPWRNARSAGTFLLARSEIHWGAMAAEPVGPCGAATDVQSRFAFGGRAGDAAATQTGSCAGGAVDISFCLTNLFRFSLPSRSD